MMRPPVYLFRSLHGGQGTADRRCWRMICSCALILAVFLMAACSTEDDKPPVRATKTPTISALQPGYPREPLPKGIHWVTNESDPEFADPRARHGGTLHLALSSFPLTFRVVGPDSNTRFRSAILGNQLNLIGVHPNTLPRSGHPLGLRR